MSNKASACSVFAETSISPAAYDPRDAQRVCSVKSNGHESVLHGSYVCRHRRTTAQGGVHGAVHDAFMTLASYTRIREGEGHELGRGVRSGSHRVRSRLVSAT